jgi:hypothetical protein
MIAKGRLTAVSEFDQEELVIEISKPVGSDNVWCCRIDISGTRFAGTYNIKGEDSLSALCLALEFIRKLLVGEEARGVMYTLPGNEKATFSYPLKAEERISVNAYFGKIDL